MNVINICLAVNSEKLPSLISLAIHKETYLGLPHLHSTCSALDFAGVYGALEAKGWGKNLI